MSRRLRFLLLVLWAIGVAALVPLALWGAAAGIGAFANNSRFVSTSNASVTGDVVAIGSLNQGRVVDIRVAPGSTVQQGDVLANIELPAAVRTASNGAPVLAFLGSKDQEVEVTAPVDGVVAAVTVSAGTAVNAGQTIMRLVDPSRFWVTTYVDEADISRIRFGQQAEVHLTALNRSLPGTVQVIVPATSVALAAPTPAPTNTSAPTGGDRVYPVYIRVDLKDNPELLGSSADVKIRVR